MCGRMCVCVRLFMPVWVCVCVWSITFEFLHAHTHTHTHRCVSYMNDARGLHQMINPSADEVPRARARVCV